MNPSNAYRFSEKLVLHVNPQEKGRNRGDYMEVDVTIYANSTLTLQKDYQRQRIATPFPLLVKDLLLRYNLERLVIQSSSESTSASPSASSSVSIDAPWKLSPDIGTPVGISILARLVVPVSTRQNLVDQQFTLLLRSLNIHNLFSCGATPFSSILHSHDELNAGRYNPQHLQVPNPVRRRKQTLLGEDNHTAEILDYHVVLPTSDVGIGTFVCEDSLQSFLALTSPCASSKEQGIMAPGPTSQILHESRRKHLWIDAAASPTCFADSDNQDSDDSCVLSLAQGIS